jgi:RimJ/RimL family protein N-acetyltransferase
VLIETERLYLRPMTVQDLDHVVALRAHPEVVRSMGPLDRQVAIERLEAEERQWSERGHGRFVVLDRETGAFLGRAGLYHWPQFDETEVGWVLRPEVWGHGYATEAARACLAWGFRDLDLPYITAMVRPDNHRSIRVTERLGMTALREDVLLDIPVVVYAIDRQTWPAVER